jgi:putative endonuclease
VTAQTATTAWYVYMLRCQDGSLYTGVTVNPVSNLDRHNRGKAARYTRSRRPCIMVYVVQCESKQDAYQTEFRIKRMPKAVKELMVQRGAGVGE